MNNIIKSLQLLKNYIESENFKGYDPYDTLNSWVPFHWLGKWGPILAIQFQKRNPINIRSLIGIKKFNSTKGMGLLITAYLKLYAISKDQNLMPPIQFIKNWLLENKSRYNGYFCWGYDYPYVNVEGKVNKGFPTVVHHSYIINSLFEYYKVFKENDIRKIIIDSSLFILDAIPRSTFDKGICFGYNPNSKGCCYNASLHAAHSLALACHFTKDERLFSLIRAAVDFVVSQQKESGVWYYSFKEFGGEERKQIDFHQGFILESIYDIKQILNYSNEDWERAIIKGLSFYKNQQFFPNGQSLWRLPKVYPVDIHNQSQGIITFSKLKDYSEGYLQFAKTIAYWTINNMQDKKGYFYYQNFKFHKHKISYMRWSNAWMFLALVTLQKYVSNNAEEYICS